MDASITIILPVRNGSAYIEQALRSALAQTFQNIQLVVSDNGSTDSTPLILSKYLIDPRVKLIIQTEPLDMFGHFNKCLDMTNTKYFMMLHHDDYLYDLCALEKAFDVLEKNPHISAVYSDMAFVDKVGSLINFRRFNREGIVNSDNIAKNSVISIRNLYGVPLLIRSKAIEGLRYDKKLTYAADLDFSIAISIHGSIYHIQKPQIAYRVHGKNASVNLFKLALAQMKLIANKHDISLSRIDKLYMFFNAWKVTFLKWAFFQYIGKIRKYAQ